MVSLPMSQDVRGQWRDIGRRTATGLAWLLFAVGWTIAKALRLIVTSIGAVLFAVGWLAGAVAWPALCWCGRAVLVGWQEGRKPIGGPRGPA